jgi:hypothetical protein
MMMKHSHGARAKNWEIQRCLVPRGVRLVEFAPRKAGLVETHCHQSAHFYPVGPGWTEPKGDEDPCTICGAGLVETLSLPKSIVIFHLVRSGCGVSARHRLPSSFVTTAVFDSHGVETQ